MSKELNSLMKKVMKKSKQDCDKQEAERQKKQDEENAKVSPEMRKMRAYVLLV